jgi:hypothetical protein
LFERAHGLEPTARTFRTIGMAAFNQGDYVAAIQNLEAALVDRRKPLTDAQQAHVSQLLELSNQRIGRFRVRVQPEGARLLVDGKSPALSRGGELLLVPGRHELDLEAQGRDRLTRDLEVQARDRAPLELNAAEAAPPPSQLAVETSTSLESDSISARTTATSDSDGGRRTWAVIALAAGGAGLLTSGIAAAFAVKKKSVLNSACPQRQCAPDYYDQVDSYNTLRTVSGVALGTALVGAGVGAYLVLSGDRESDTHVAAVVSPNLIGIRGRL